MSPLGRSQSAFEAAVFSLKCPSPLTAKPRAKALKTPAPSPKSPASPSQVPPSSPPSPGALTRPSPHQRQQRSSGEGPRSSPPSNPDPRPHLGDQQDSQKLPDHPLPHPGDPRGWRTHRPQRARGSPSFSGTKASLHLEGSGMDGAQEYSEEFGSSPLGWKLSSGRGTRGSLALACPSF